MGMVELMVVSMEFYHLCRAKHAFTVKYPNARKYNDIIDIVKTGGIDEVGCIVVHSHFTYMDTVIDAEVGTWPWISDWRFTVKEKEILYIREDGTIVFEKKYLPFRVKLGMWLGL